MYPAFTEMRYLYQFKQLESKYTDLLIPHEPYAEHGHRHKALLLFLEHIKDPQVKIPQIVLLQFEVPPELYLRLISEEYGGCYELVKTSIYWVVMDYGDGMAGAAQKSRRRYLLRVK